MKKRPILFSAPMVRALLDGSKTQTRRVAKLTDAAHVKEVGGHRRWHPADPNAALACPYGQPGDQLWVRETWNDASSSLHSCVLYLATDGVELYGGKWVPSIYMPRWASRITLEIVGVRVERLQDISEADAAAEGVSTWAQGALSPDGQTADPSDQYRWLWESINGSGSWYANQWVWVVEFKVVKP